MRQSLRENFAAVAFAVVYHVFWIAFGGVAGWHLHRLMQ